MELIRIELEYILGSPKKLVYERISSSYGLSEWFADSVNVTNEVEYTFNWGKESSKLILIEKKINNHTIFKWLDKTQTNATLEFRINQSDLTKETTLTIIDFVEIEEINWTKEFYNQKIKNLKTVLGV